VHLAVPDDLRLARLDAIFDFRKPTLDIAHWLERAKAIFTLREYEAWAGTHTSTSHDPQPGPSWDTGGPRQRYVAISSTPCRIRARIISSIRIEVGNSQPRRIRVSRSSTTLPLPRQFSRLEPADLKYFQESLSLQTRFRVRSQLLL